MADFEREQILRQTTAAAVDQGLRSYMLRIFNLLALSLAVSGGVAYAASASGIYLNLAQNMPVLFFAMMFAPLGILFFLMFRINALQHSTLQTLFWAFVLLNGFSLGHVFELYTGGSIARVFMITAITFSACSIYGYTTKRDLGPLQTFFLISVIGLLVAMIVNMFLQSTVFHFAISAMGVLIFAGITAFETQNLKNIYLQFSSRGREGAVILRRAALMGTLSLYISFINMFLFLLQFFGDRR